MPFLMTEMAEVKRKPPARSWRPMEPKSGIEAEEVVDERRGVEEVCKVHIAADDAEEPAGVGDVSV